MSEPTSEACKRYAAAALEPSREVGHSSDDVPIASGGNHPFSRSGCTFDRVFNSDAIDEVDLPSLQGLGKSLAGAVAMTALKGFPNLLHRVEKEAWGWLVHLFEKKPGGVEGELIGSVALKQGKSVKDHIAQISHEVGKWRNRGPSLEREAKEADAVRLKAEAVQIEAEARAAQKAAWLKKTERAAE